MRVVPTDRAEKPALSVPTQPIPRGPKASASGSHHALRQYVCGNKADPIAVRALRHPVHPLSGFGDSAGKAQPHRSLVIDSNHKSAPTKVRSVEYVKICSLYGVGYYYIPGTDTCIKIGGYVRFETYHNEVGGHYADRLPGGGDGTFTRNSSTYGMQARFRLTGDVRTQTEYGTLRSYFAFGVNALNLGGQSTATLSTAVLAMERAFIQFAGFTIGRSDTFFAFYNGAAYGLVPMFLDGGSGPAGHNVFAYTWQFGNGLSASLSVEDSAARIRSVIDLNSTNLFGPTDRSGIQVPDLVANLRVDQAWGSAQIMGGLAKVRANYYTGTGVNCTGNNTTCAHPSDEYGWGVGAGLTLKMPWDAKDTFSGVIAYAEGATGFVSHANAQQFLHKQGIALGVQQDAVFADPNSVNGYGGGLELTTAWGGTVAFEHYWTPSLRTSWVFGYMTIEYGDNAKALIARGGCSGASGRLVPGTVTNCDPDYSFWRVASRTMWNPVANLDVGVEIAYNKVETAFAGAATFNGAAMATQGLAAGTYAIEDQSYWSAALRVQRNFWP
jgi:hypothetical protein